MHRSSSIVRIVTGFPSPSRLSRTISYNYLPEQEDRFGHAQLELSAGEQRTTSLPRFIGFGYGSGRGTGRPVTQEPPLRGTRVWTIDLGEIRHPRLFEAAVRHFDTSICDPTGETGPSCTVFVHFAISAGGVLRLDHPKERLRPSKLAQMILDALNADGRPAEAIALAWLSDEADDEAPPPAPDPTPAPPPPAP